MGDSGASHRDEPVEVEGQVRVIPWLCSASAHCALLILLALCISTHPGAAEHGGPTTGIALDSALVNTTASPEQYADEGPAVEMPASDGPAADEPTEASSETVADSQALASGGGPLSDVLASKPPLDFAGLLPGGSPALGAGALEGGGISAARASTSGSPGSKSLKGGYARTGVFGLQGEGYNFVYVFDRSGSMGGHGGAPLAAAKAQLLASLKPLGNTHQFQIIFYNEQPHVFNLSGTPGKLVFGNEHNKALAAQFVESIKADGATSHEDALAMALRMGPDVIFFLTDADEPTLKPHQLDHLARINKGTSINTVEFGFGPQADSENFLVQLARENGGKHIYVDIAELPAP